MESSEYTRQLTETLHKAKTAYIEKLFNEGKSKEEITQEDKNILLIFEELQLLRNLRHQIELR